MPRNNETPLPPIDGHMTDGFYYTKNTRIDENALLSKSEMREMFVARFGYPPQEVFYGKPNGSLVYAGPVINPFARPDAPATETPSLQQTETQMPLFE